MTGGLLGGGEHFNGTLEEPGTSPHCYCFQLDDSTPCHSNFRKGADYVWLPHQNPAAQGGLKKWKATWTTA